jgi:hypothetical protein
VTPIQTIASNDADQLENISRWIEAEPPDAVRARERRAFDDLASPPGERLVLFGAGLLGKPANYAAINPCFAVCTYHRSNLWQIPNLIRSIAPEYHIFLRRYAEECWGGVCYAIPKHRLKRA